MESSAVGMCFSDREKKMFCFFFSAERITFKCWTEKDVYSLLILQHAPTGCFIKHTGTGVAVERRHTVYTGLQR